MALPDWKPLNAFAGYEISDRGEVRRSGRICRLNPAGGYLRVFIDGKYRAVHRLVLETFVGLCPDGHEACHINGIRDDNRVENLRWGTRSSNLRDRHAHGRGFIKHGRYVGRHKDRNQIQRVAG